VFVDFGELPDYIIGSRRGMANRSRAASYTLAAGILVQLHGCFVAAKVCWISSINGLVRPAL
jgi:hypothetical protein